MNKREPEDQPVYVTANNGVKFELVPFFDHQEQRWLFALDRLEDDEDD